MACQFKILMLCPRIISRDTRSVHSSIFHRRSASFTDHLKISAVITFLLLIWPSIRIQGLILCEFTQETNVHATLTVQNAQLICMKGICYHIMTVQISATYLRILNNAGLHSLSSNDSWQLYQSHTATDLRVHAGDLPSLWKNLMYVCYSNWGMRSNDDTFPLHTCTQHSNMSHQPVSVCSTYRTQFTPANSTPPSVPLNVHVFHPKGKTLSHSRKHGF
jgi:hypothetical protein